MSFISPPERPVHSAPFGLRFDFNYGARVQLPEGEWHVRLLDDESGNILFSCDSGAGWINSTKTYYVRFRIQVFKKGEETPFLDEVMDLKDRDVLISFPVGTLGDIIAWFHSAEVFRQKHACRLECVLAKELIPLFREQYPEIELTSPEEKRRFTPYATFRIGLFFKGNTTCQPVDFRYVGFHHNAAYILGILPQEHPPRLNLNAPRQIAEPYVCIGVQSTTQAKHWNNGTGWTEVVTRLKELGYRVLCIDRQAHGGEGFVWNHIPWGAEDYTGNIPLQKRVDLLRHASFFVGLSSGLSWLAWASGTPVVLISGFSLPASEFPTPWRVFNPHGCNGCWDDTTVDFDHKDFFWCPRHKGTERQYECSRLITGRQVIGVIDKLHVSLNNNERESNGK